jgi:hypothetical protein
MDRLSANELKTSIGRSMKWVKSVQDIIDDSVDDGDIENGHRDVRWSKYSNSEDISRDFVLALRMNLRPTQIKMFTRINPSRLRHIAHLNLAYNKIFEK